MTVDCTLFRWTTHKTKYFCSLIHWGSRNKTFSNVCVAKRGLVTRLYNWKIFFLLPTTPPWVRAQGPAPKVNYHLLQKDTQVRSLREGRRQGSMITFTILLFKISTRFGTNLKKRRGAQLKKRRDYRLRLTGWRRGQQGKVMSKKRRAPHSHSKNMMWTQRKS